MILSIINFGAVLEYEYAKKIEVFSVKYPSRSVSPPASGASEWVRRNAYSGVPGTQCQLRELQ